MKKIAFLFPKNRKRLINDVEKGLAPDNLLYGYNHLRAFYNIEEIEISPRSEKIVNAFLSPISWFFHSRHTKINLGRALLALPQLWGADVIVTCVDSVNKAVSFLKKIGLLSQPLICMAGNVMDGTENLPFLHRWVWSGTDIMVVHAPVDLEKLAKIDLYDRGVMIAVGSDEGFWKSSREKAISRHIISIGSDRDRDYQTLIRTAWLLPDFSFEIHTSAHHAISLHPPANVKIVTNATPQYSRLVLQKASLVVIPLKETYRAAGQLALFDALLMKKTVIVTATRGVVEVYGLKHKQSVFLIQPGNVATLVDALKILQSSPVLRNKIGAGGRRIAIRYTTRSYAERIQNVIKNIFQKNIRSAN